MARWDRLTGALLLGFAVYTIVAAAGMGYWQGRIPGPGFAPIWIGAGLALCALVLLVRRPAGQDAPPPAPAVREAGRREALLALGIGAVTTAAMLLIPRIGMLAGLGLLLVVLIRLLGGTWRAALGSGLALPIAFHLVFVRWLAVSVPRGPWGF